jgi:hypothetical protein
VIVDVSEEVADDVIDVDTVVVNVVDTVEVAVLVIDVDGLFTVVSVEVTDVDTEEVTLLVSDDERLVVKLEVNVVDNDEVMVDVDDVVCVLVTVVWSQFRKLPRLNSFRAKLSFEVSSSQFSP